jgi:hypothetical protein
MVCGVRAADACGRSVELIELQVFGVSFMVKLLRACVWMPRHKQAMKDVASCEKLRGGASNL